MAIRHVLYGCRSNVLVFRKLSQNNSAGLTYKPCVEKNGRGAATHASLYLCIELAPTDILQRLAVFCLNKNIKARTQARGRLEFR